MRTQWRRVTIEHVPEFKITIRADSAKNWAYYIMALISILVLPIFLWWCLDGIISGEGVRGPRGAFELGSTGALFNAWFGMVLGIFLLVVGVPTGLHLALAREIILVNDVAVVVSSSSVIPFCSGGRTYSRAFVKNVRRQNNQHWQPAVAFETDSPSDSNPEFIGVGLTEEEADAIVAALQRALGEPTSKPTASP